MFYAALMQSGAFWANLQLHGQGMRRVLPTSTHMKRPRRDRWYYGLAILVTLAVTCLMLLIDPPLDQVTIGLAYLLGVVAIAASAGYGPGLLTALLSFTAFNFFFLPPRFSLHIANSQGLFQLATFLGVALIAGALAAYAHAQAEASRRSGAETIALYELSQRISAEVELDRILPAIATTTSELLSSPSVVVLLYDANGHLSERARTGTESATHAIQHVFIRDGAIVLGDLRVAERQNHRFDQHEQRLLDAIAAQVRLAIDRARLAQQAAHSQALAESDQLKSALLSSVSHDLRTPLATIKGASLTLLANDLQLDEATSSTLLHTIDAETDRLNRIIGNWLAIARIAAGTLRFERDWQSMAELVGAATARNAWAALTLHIAVPDDLPLVWANAALVDQVITNLLENAARYTPPGGAIHVTAQRCDDNAAFVAVTIADSGPGIEPAELPYIFDAFFSGAPPPGKQRGSGMGLAICKGIIEAHGGRIWAGRGSSGGATFTFTLPTRDV